MGKEKEGEREKEARLVHILLYEPCAMKGLSPSPQGKVQNSLVLWN